jgi:purine-nucleoside phosphorylase
MAVETSSVLDEQRERRVEAAAFLRDALPFIPETLVELGTGQGGFAARMTRVAEVDFASIPHFKRSTAPTHQGRLIAGRLGDSGVLVMQGRLHLYEGHSWDDVTFPIRVAHELGMRRLVACNGGGSVNPYYRTSDVMLIRDHINLLWGNPLVGPVDPALGPEFVDMTDAYSPRLRKIARDVAGRAGIQLHEGVYVANLGRTYETPAESFMAYRMGGDIVGMSTVPEVIVARYLGMEVLGISVVGNVAAGFSQASLPTSATANMGNFDDLLEGVLREILPLPIGEEASDR